MGIRVGPISIRVKWSDQSAGTFDVVVCASESKNTKKIDFGKRTWDTDGHLKFI